jgi:hypothetical protein
MLVWRCKGPDCDSAPDSFAGLAFAATSGQDVAASPPRVDFPFGMSLGELLAKIAGSADWRASVCRCSPLTLMLAGPMISSPLSWRDLCRPQNCGSSGRKNGSRSYPSYGLSCFHYKELYEWPKSRRSDLIADLCGIIRPYVAAKTGVAVVNREMAAIFSESERKNWRINAYAVAGRTVAREMRLWCQRGSGILPELVYERGDVGQDKLTHLLTSQGYPNPIFKPKIEIRGSQERDCSPACRSTASGRPVGV